MSANLKYKESITHSIWEEWKLVDARIVAGKVAIEPGGYIQFTKAPRLEEEKGIPEKYKVVITYDNSNLPPLYSKSNLMFELHMTPVKSQENGKYKAITTSAHPNTSTSTGLDECVTYVDAKGGMADVFRVVLRNNLGYDITVVKVDVHPSYAVDDATLIEIEQHIPSVLHGTNENRIVVTKSEEPTELITMDVGTVMSTNLQVHFMVNGTISEDADVVLDFTVDDEHLQYSPLEFRLPAGPFLLGIPANIMQVESGNNTFKVHMNVSNGTVDIKPYKVQCTIDGKGMLSKSSSTAPVVNELIRIPFVDVTDNARDISLSFMQTQCTPISTTGLLVLTAHDITRDKTVAELIGIEQVRVAEDVWFGPSWENGYDPGTHEIFDYNNNVIRKFEGGLQFVDSDSVSRKFINTANWKRGDLYTIELDHTETSKYERLNIRNKKQSIKLNSIEINSDTFTCPEGYVIDDGVSIITRNEFTSNVGIVTNEDEWYTSAVIEIDEVNYNDIKELE